jgi:hypothetical protein
MFEIEKHVEGNFLILKDGEIVCYCTKEKNATMILKQLKSSQIHCGLDRVMCPMLYSGCSNPNYCNGKETIQEFEARLQKQASAQQPQA